MLAFYFRSLPKPTLSNITLKTLTVIQTYNLSTQQSQPPNPNPNPLDPLLEEYKKNGHNFNQAKKITFVGQVIKLSNRKGVGFEDAVFLVSCVGEVVGALRLDLGELLARDGMRSGLFKIVADLCMSSFMKLLKRTQQKTNTLQTIQNPQLLQTLLHLFPLQPLSHKSLITRFLTLYHPQHKAAHQTLHSLIHKQNPLDMPGTRVQDLIFYLREVLACYQLDREADIEGFDRLMRFQVLGAVVRAVQRDILMVQPKMLWNFSRLLVGLMWHPRAKELVSCGVILTAVEEHAKGLDMIDSFNTMDAVYLVQVLQHVVVLSQQQGKELKVDKVRQLTQKIYNLIKKVHHIAQKPQHQQQQQQEQEQQQEQQAQREQQQQQQQQQQTNYKKNNPKPKQLRLIDTNILLQSMLKLAVIDPTLFSILEARFFSLLPTADTMDIQAYVIARMKVVRAVMASLRTQARENAPEKVRLVKQEHVRFVLGLLGGLQSNASLGVRDKLNIVQICQQVPAKSRKIKKILSTMTTAPGMSKEELAYAELIAAGF